MYFLKTSLLFFSLIFFTRPSRQERVLNRSYEISVINHVNQTGHCLINFELVHASRVLRKYWRANIKHEIFEEGGIDKHYVKGQLTAPPPKPKDYELFPGVGFYKFHPKAKTFQEGMSICSQEGGHLLIVNSEAEANVVKTMYARHPKIWNWANIGFHDPNRDRNYKTLFGSSLTAAGYNIWYPGEPDLSQTSEFCGVIKREGLLGVGVCHRERPFFCEYDLTWSTD